MTRGFISCMVALALVLPAPAAAAAPTALRMLVASARDTSNETGRDIALLAADAADVELEVLPSIATDALRRLRYERSVQLAIVPADVLQALVDAAAGGDAEATDIARPLRVLMPLYVDEVHFVVRADSPLDFVDEIRDARIAFGERGSGAAHTTAALYRLMFDAAAPAPAYMPAEEALVKLITDRSVDVVSIVGGQPAPLIAAMKPEARRFVKLLRWSSRHPATERVLSSYHAATLRARSYPNLLAEDVPAVGVRVLLVVHDHESRPLRDALARLARSLCRNLPLLQKHGHAKWREVTAMLPELASGLAYHAATSKEINLCLADRIGGTLDLPSR